MRILFLLSVLALITAGCDDEMVDQSKYRPYERSPLFADGAANQVPPTGTVARGDLARLAALSERPEMTLGLLRRGRERFEIFCSPCHGRLGDGRGAIPRRGFPTPPTFHQPRLRDAPDTHFLKVIGSGYGAMHAYAAAVPPADRWAIVAYIRALQRSQQVTANELSPRQRQQAEEGSR